jgi:peptidyl-prolyl cis-trans isomerase A (cyclophilin A)
MFKRFANFAVPFALATAASAQDAPAPPPAAVDEPETVLVVLETTMGDITAAIETERAPITAANFLRYVDERRFDGIVFYRAMPLEWGEQPNGLIQAGTQHDPERVLPPIAHEPTSQTGVTHVRGALSMARNAPGTATGDFSIMLQEQPGMDADPASDDPELRAGYAAFGHVVEGMDVVEAIHAAPTDPDKGEGWMKGQMLADPVEIVEARRVVEQ